jgi:hypothetical protein
MAIMRPALIYLTGGAAGFAIASLATYFLAPSQFTAEAVLQGYKTEQPQLTALLPNVLARSSISNLILTHNLYEKERRVEPLEDTIERMRRNIHVSRTAGQLTVAFRYPNPDQAHRVTNDLAFRLIATFHDEQKNQNAIWTQTWLDASEAAANAWNEATAFARTNPSTRAAYDADLARQHYAALREKLAASRLEATILKRNMGPRLEFQSLAL